MEENPIEQYLAFVARDAENISSLPDEPESQLFNDLENSLLREVHTANDEESPLATAELQQQFNPEVLLPLTNSTQNPISTWKIEFCDYLPEYPKTHPQGFTYVINTQGMSQNQKANLIHDFQYSRKKAHPEKEIFCSYLGVRVKKYKFKCTGVKICEFLPLTLRTLSHEEVTEEVTDEIQNVRKNLHPSPLNTSEKDTISLFFSVQKRFQQNVACSQQEEDCTPYVGHYEQEGITQVHQPFIGCTQSTRENFHSHFHKPLAGLSPKINIDFLKSLFDTRALQRASSMENCGTIEHTSSRRANCGNDHPQGPGKMEILPCEVEFHIMIPLDLSGCPFVLFISHGIHQHPPPPPNKPPQSILAEIIDVIRRIQDPDLTVNTFLKNPLLYDFCQSYRGKSLVQIHASFANMDRFSALIKKQKILLYPEGRDFNGVMYEWYRRPEFREYVQDIFNDDRGIMIFCGFPEQIKILASLKSFEVDMCYKRVRGDGFNEVTFATFLPEHGKIFTLLRVLTNQETTEGYRLLFQRVFLLMERITGLPVKFLYLHDEGIRAIIVDMDSKQMAGLGAYLRFIDPLHRPWTWQLLNIIIFCRVHFQRSIEKIARKYLIPGQSKFHTIHGIMMGLLDCKSADEYMELVGLLQTHDDPDVVHWAEHKAHEVIRAGLNKHCSLIPAEFYDEIRNFTNAVEQTHYKSYSVGKYLSLLAAILNSRILDQRDVDQYQTREQHGIHHSYRSDSMSSRYFNHLAREARKRKKYLESQEVIPSVETNNAILFRANSSGGIIQPRASSRGRSREERSRSRSRVSRSISTAPPSSRSQSTASDLQRAASVNLQSQNTKTRKEQLLLQKMEADIANQIAQTRKEEAEAKRLELANRETELRLMQLQRQLERQD